MFGKLQDGGTLPAWAKYRPVYHLKLRLQDEDWGHRVTNIYKAAKTRAVLNHSNVDEIAQNSTDVQKLVVDCTQDASHLAADKKREAQRLIGVYVETLRDRMNAAEDKLKTKLLLEKPPVVMSEEQRIDARRDAVTNVERRILDHFSGRITGQDMDNSQDEVDDSSKSSESSTDLDDKRKGFDLDNIVPRDNSKDKDKSQVKGTGVGAVLNDFIDWLTEKSFYKPKRGRGELNETMLYTPTYLVRSVAGQLTLELNKVYGHGSHELYKKGLTSRQRKKAGHRAAVRMFSLDDIRNRLDRFEKKEDKKGKKVEKDMEDKEDKEEKGYVLRGSIRTDGFRVQLLAFKLRELQDVRYRRLEKDLLPPRLTSIVGGTDYYLQEIHHVITRKDDVEKYWPNVRVEDIKTLTLDGGQACVTGAFAHLPDKLVKSSMDKESAGTVSPMDGISATSITGQNSTTIAPAAKDSPHTVAAGQESTATPAPSPRSVFFNLAVKSKAVYQPTFRFQRWLEGEKKTVPEGERDSISDIEGQDSIVINYVEELKRVEKRLKTFYGGLDHKYKNHRWDMERARQAEYQLTADQLLRTVGGSIGQRYDPCNPVLIGVGLGKFSTKSSLSSLHSTFLDYCIRTARAQGYLVVGLNEYYTSKNGPGCGCFVAQVDMRRFYCSHCHCYYHRDVMAAENMTNLIQGHLVDQQRPKYLQPAAADGSYPWMASPGSGSSTSSGGIEALSITTSSSSTNTAKRTPGRRK
ncbi:hypothetical protein KI688_006843 [Linnemannia hyalina]|uniref:Cas12f1-like TNB domain-containing protein n=1 Tax=Linnemannia hyalina TaxID=64524 RepID=A0A9P7XJM5_9FUNG|nr:hypothetical protein KI688_006843 [Linnemannia hyalina]